jgi:hypothetical protein
MQPLPVVDRATLEIELCTGKMFTMGKSIDGEILRILFNCVFVFLLCYAYIFMYVYTYVFYIFDR